MGKLQNLAQSIPLGPFTCWATNPGTLGITSNGSGAANIYCAFGTIGTGKTLDKFRIYVSGVTGTLTSLVCEIRPEKSTGGPDTNGTALTNGTVTLTTGLPTGAGWLEFSGFNCVLAQDAQYYAVIYNNSSGAASTLTVQMIPLGPNGQVSLGSGLGGYCKIHGTDGVTFATVNYSATVGPVFVYADGSYTGTSMVGAGTSDTTSRFYSGVECGCKFTCPPHTILNIAGFTFAAFTKTGAPTGDVTAKIYINGSLIYTSPAIMDASLVSNRGLVVSTPIRLNPGDECRAVLTNSGGTVSAYNKLTYTNMDADYPPQTQLLNFQLTQLSGGTWTDTPSKIPNIFALLDPVQPFAPAPLNRRKFTNQR